MSFAIYGAYGYTGELIAREAQRRGLSPLLLGRREAPLAPLAEELGLEHRAVSIDEELVDVLKPMTSVIHCAGPFFRTWKAMADVCVQSKTHYLDITGEISVFEGAAAYGSKAAKAGIAIMPGVGFDVVPTDCLAKHLSDQLPGATELNLAILLLGGMSRGTASTLVAGLGEGGAVRKGGRIVKVLNAHDVRKIDFGRGPVRCCTIPWGDVSTAFYSTNIPNIAVYASVPGPAITMMSLMGGFGATVMGSSGVQSVLQGYIDRNMYGPDDEARAKGKSVCWGEVIKGDERKSAILTGPEGYTLTALTALNAAARVEAGDIKAGFQTPAKMWGADFVREVESVEITDQA